MAYNQGSDSGHSPDEVVVDKEYHEAKRKQERHDDGETSLCEVHLIKVGGQDGRDDRRRFGCIDFT